MLKEQIEKYIEIHSEIEKAAENLESRIKEIYPDYSPIFQQPKSWTYKGMTIGDGVVYLNYKYYDEDTDYISFTFEQICDPDAFINKLQIALDKRNKANLKAQEEAFKKVREMELAKLAELKAKYGDI